MWVTASRNQSGNVFSVLEAGRLFLFSPKLSRQLTFKGVVTEHNSSKKFFWAVFLSLCHLVSAFFPFGPLPHIPFAFFALSWFSAVPQTVLAILYVYDVPFFCSTDKQITVSKLCLKKNFPTLHLFYFSSNITNHKRKIKPLSSLPFIICHRKRTARSMA